MVALDRGRPIEVFSGTRAVEPVKLHGERRLGCEHLCGSALEGVPEVRDRVLHLRHVNHVKVVSHPAVTIVSTEERDGRLVA